MSCRSCPSCPSRTPSPSDACPGKLLLVGNPNVGKSALFSRLTGTHALSSNYPGTTVGFLEGRLIHGDRCYRLVDVPGSYTLAATNEAEEIASRIVDEGADAAILVLDATALERNLVLALEGREQRVAYYLANGLLSAISDNVFVATVYVTETAQAFKAGLLSREQFELLAVAINTGTNIPSIATPNGQAAFLFLLTSTLAPLIRLSYGRMVRLALPYTVVLTLTGLVATWLY